jgi:hypothetical protein
MYFFQINCIFFSSKMVKKHVLRELIFLYKGPPLTNRKNFLGFIEGIKSKNLLTLLFIIIITILNHSLNNRFNFVYIYAD